MISRRKCSGFKGVMKVVERENKKNETGTRVIKATL